MITSRALVSERAPLADYVRIQNDYGVEVSELDEAWDLALTEAAEKARAAGRADLTDYLTLRRSNDLARTIAKDWLLDTFAMLAGEANMAGAGINLSREGEHRFKIGNASMVGSSLSLAKGVRAVIVEVGWPRVPRDGFIRGGGLALANIRHVGMKSASATLRLIVEPDGPPRWMLEDRHGEIKTQFHEDDLRTHITVFLDYHREHPPRS